MESSQFLRTHLSTRTKLLVRERSCETNLFLFQSEGVNIVRSHVANQHRGVCRIKTHPKVESPCETESLQIDNALRIAIRYADSKRARIIPAEQEVMNWLSDDHVGCARLAGAATQTTIVGFATDGTTGNSCAFL
jgi:hypothetical protein